MTLEMLHKCLYLIFGYVFLLLCCFQPVKELRRTLFHIGFCLFGSYSQQDQCSLSIRLLLYQNDVIFLNTHTHTNIHSTTSTETLLCHRFILYIGYIVCLCSHLMDYDNIHNNDYNDSNIGHKNSSFLSSHLYGERAIVFENVCLCKNVNNFHMSIDKRCSLSLSSLCDENQRRASR